MVKLFLDFLITEYGVLDFDLIPSCVPAQLLCLGCGGLVTAAEESLGSKECVVWCEVAGEWLKLHIQSFREKTQVQLSMAIQTDEFEDFLDDELAFEHFDELVDVLLSVEAP